MCWSGAMADTEEVPDLPDQFVIREHRHRIHDPFSPEKLSRLGASLELTSGTSVLDLCSGSGEMLCTWARDHGISGVGVDLSSVFTQNAVARSVELDVDGVTTFVHSTAEAWLHDHVSGHGEPFDVAACIGGTWIGGDVFGTIDLLEQVLRPGGLVLVGEGFWNRVPETEEIAQRCHVAAIDDVSTLPDLVAGFARNGWDLVQMVLADRDDWDRYVAAQWFSIRRWLDAHPGHELWDEMRAELDTAALDHIRYQRDYVGWGVFALMRR